MIDFPNILKKEFIISQYQSLLDNEIQTEFGREWFVFLLFIYSNLYSLKIVNSFLY